MTKRHLPFRVSSCQTAPVELSLYKLLIMSVQQWITPLQGVDSLRQTEGPMPIPKHGEVLVKIHAVSLNYRDVEGWFVPNDRPLRL